jgi:hypothetical protein
MLVYQRISQNSEFLWEMMENVEVMNHQIFECPTIFRETNLAMAPSPGTLLLTQIAHHGCSTHSCLIIFIIFYIGFTHPQAILKTCENGFARPHMKFSLVQGVRGPLALHPRLCSSEDGSTAALALDPWDAHQKCRCTVYHM